MPDPVNQVPESLDVEPNQAEQDPALVLKKRQEKAAPTSSGSDTVLGLMVWGAIIVGVVISNSQPTRKFVVDYWWAFAIAALLLLIIATVYQPLRQKIKSSVHTRVGSIIAVLAGISILEGAISTLPPRYQILALRSTFLLVVCLFPVILYYLFITTRKYSLLNEFITNLDRLGLLSERSRTQATPTAIAPDSGLNLRILTYVQKFEAVYGSLDPDLVNELLSAPDPGAVFARPEWNRKATSGFISIFTPETTAPLVIATGLIALGWIIALPPWKTVSPPAEPTVMTIVDAPVKSATQQTPANPQQPATSPQTSAAAAGQPNTTGSQNPPPSQATQPQTTAQPEPAQKAASPPPVTPNKKSVTVDAPVSWLSALYPDDSPVYYAFLGAYFFGIQMLFRRYVLKDLRTSAYVAVSMRIILAVVGTWVLIPAARFLKVFSDSDPSKVHTNSLLLVVGFVIGVFPPVIWQFIQAAFKKLPGVKVVLPSLSTALPLSGLDGLTVWHEARLEEEDIENIPNMATSNLVDLMLNTRFSPDRIIDWVDQSILYMHLGPEKNSAESRRDKLRAHGIRTATSLIVAYRKSDSASDDRKQFEAILSSNGRSVVHSLVDTLFTSPNLELVRNWRGLEPLEACQSAAAGKSGP